MDSQPDFENADLFYERQLDAHQALRRKHLDALNTALVLILADELGNRGRKRRAQGLAATLKKVHPMWACRPSCPARTGVPTCDLPF